MYKIIMTLLNALLRYVASPEHAQTFHLLTPSRLHSLHFPHSHLPLPLRHLDPHPHPQNQATQPRSERLLDRKPRSKNTYRVIYYTYDKTAARTCGDVFIVS